MKNTTQQKKFPLYRLHCTMPPLTIRHHNLSFLPLKLSLLRRRLINAPSHQLAQSLRRVVRQAVLQSSAHHRRVQFFTHGGVVLIVFLNAVKGGVVSRYQYYVNYVATVEKAGGRVSRPIETALIPLV